MSELKMRYPEFIILTMILTCFNAWPFQGQYLPASQTLKWEFQKAADPSDYSTTTNITLRSFVTVGKIIDKYLPEINKDVCPYYSTINRQSGPEMVDILFSTNTPTMFLELPKMFKKDSDACDSARTFLVSNPDLITVMSAYNEKTWRNLFMFSEGMVQIFKACYSQPVSVLRNIFMTREALESNILFCYKRPFVQMQKITRNYLLKVKNSNSTEEDVCSKILSLEHFLDCAQFAPQIYLIRHQYFEYDYPINEQLDLIENLQVEHVRDTTHCPTETTLTYDGKKLHWIGTRVNKVSASVTPCLTQYGKTIRRRCIVDPYAGAYWSKAPTVCYNNIDTPSNDTESDHNKYILKVWRYYEQALYRLDITCFEYDFNQCDLVDWDEDYFVYTVEDKYSRTKTEIEKIIKRDIHRQTKGVEFANLTKVYRCASPGSLNDTCVATCRGEQVIDEYWTEPPETCISPRAINQTQTKSVESYCLEDITYANGSSAQLHWKKTLAGKTTTPLETCLDDAGNQINRTCILEPSSEKPFWSEPSGNCSIPVQRTYCLAEETHSTGISLHWNDTLPYTISIPWELCLDAAGKQVTRTCIRNSSSAEPYWTEASGNCSKDVEIPEITQKLHNLRMANTTDVLSEISKITEDAAKMRADDINLVSECLTLSLTKEGNSTSDFYTAVQNVMKAPKQVLKDSQQRLNSTDKMLSLIESFTRGITGNKSGIQYIRRANILTQITYPFISGVTGLALYGSCFKDLNSYTIVEMRRGDTFDKLEPQDLDLATYVPESLIHTLTEGSTDETTNNFKIINTIFLNDALFNEIQNSNFSTGSKVVNVDIPGYPSHFETPIPLLFRPTGNFINPNCAYWDYGESKKGNWSTAGGKILSFYKTETLLRCSFKHLTNFALLISTDALIAINHNFLLTIITYPGTTLSTIGIIFILFTATTFKHWYKKRHNTIHLSVAIFFEIILMFTAGSDFLERGYSCAIVGAVLHYIVLAKFVWMLLIARVQYRKFINVLSNYQEQTHHREHVLIGWIAPLLPVFASFMIFPQNYDRGTLEFCYPKADALLFFLIIPISAIILANLIIFSVVATKVSATKLLSYNIVNTNKYKVRLIIMLFFMLGITWLLGLATVFLPGCWIKAHLICLYSFCILASFQGFVMFVFHILLDERTIALWREKLGWPSRKDLLKENAFRSYHPLISTSSTYAKKEKDMFF